MDAISDGAPSAGHRRTRGFHGLRDSPRDGSDAAVTAGFLALGSSPLATFPVPQWCIGHRLSDYSCGGSRGVSPRSLLIPGRGTVGGLIRAAAKARQRDSGRLEGGRPDAHCAPMSTQTDDSTRHKAKMANRKAAQDAEVAAKTVEKGLLVVHTGKGKGKSTAAWGLLVRALGRGLKCGVVQFGKGAWQTGERTALERFGEQIEWHTLGEGFTWETQDRARDVAAAERAWAVAQKMMADPTIRLIVLDELNITLRYDHLDAASVIAALQARRGDQHIVVTGRNAKPALIEAADLVTEMTPVKHHFAAGVKAQEGIEF